MDFETITCSVEERLLTITLNRPDRLNAFTVPMQRELCAAFDRSDQDDDVRVVIVTGAGRGFCAGADLGSGGDTFNTPAQGGPTEASDHRDEGGLLTLRIFASIKPVIAAINGPRSGSGRR